MQPEHEETRKALDLIDRIATYINACEDKEIKETIWRLISKNKTGPKT